MHVIGGGVEWTHTAHFTIQYLSFSRLQDKDLRLILEQHGRLTPGCKFKKCCILHLSTFQFILNYFNYCTIIVHAALQNKVTKKHSWLLREGNAKIHSRTIPLLGSTKTISLVCGVMPNLAAP